MDGSRSISSCNNRVVVTGIGVLCPLGLDLSTAWEGLIAGKSGIDRITLFDPEPFDTKIAGEVKGFEPTDYVSRKDAHHMDRFTQLAVAASRQAVEHAGLQIGADNRCEVGVIVGTGLGGIATLSKQLGRLLEKGPSSVSPFLLPMMMADVAPAQISIALGVKGPNFCITSSCASGSDAIGTACEIIRRGDAQAMIAGGSEAIITPIAIAAFSACGAMSRRNTEPKLASRPFDAQRDGFVMSEGSGILILENLAFAQRRGANILTEIIGYRASSDAYHITQPAKDGSDAIRAIQMALAKAGLGSTEVDYINAHGTSTRLNDQIETMVLKSVFGKHAYHIPISSTKSMMGHLIGAAGAVEAAICNMVIQHSIIPPTINLTHPDPECDLDYVPNTARRAKVTTAMSNSFGFGGHNSVLIFREYSEAQA